MDADLRDALATLREDIQELRRLARRQSGAPADPAADLLADGCLTVPQACEFSGLGKTTVRDLIADGTLKVTRVGHRVLVPKRALVALLAKSLTHAPA